MSEIINRWFRELSGEANESLYYVADEAGHRIINENGETVTLATDWTVMATSDTEAGLESLLLSDLEA